MHAPRPFTFLVGPETLAADRLEVNGHAGCLILHGAGTSDRSRWLPLRQRLADYGIGSVAIDFSGHGESSHRTPNSLAKRYSEALAALEFVDEGEQRAVVGISMSGEIAVRLATQAENNVTRLVTVVGAAYDAAAFDAPFGPTFTSILRTPDSWRESLAIQAIRTYTGRLTVVQAEHDTVVPHEIGQLLVDNARSAEDAKIVQLPGLDHALSVALRESPALVDQLAKILLRTVSPTPLPAD